MNVNLILVIIVVILTTIGTLYIAFHSKNYGTKVNIIFILSILGFMGIFQITISYLSNQTYINENIALILYKLSLIIRLLSLLILITFHNFILENNKIKKLSVIYSILLGIIVSLLFLSNSVVIFQIENEYNFKVQNSILLMLILIFYILIIGELWFVQISNYPNFRDKKAGHLLSVLIFFISLIILLMIVLFTIFIIPEYSIVRQFYSIFNFITAILLVYILIRKPHVFVALTNKLYDFIIFHRSGILLYTYNFETDKESEDTILKGSILIGINHILSNFIDKKDKLNIIKMKDRDIIFEYDANFGYALLLITNHINIINKRAVYQFMKIFSETNKELLKKISNFSQLIDVSQFENIKKIIIKCFSSYMIKN